MNKTFKNYSKHLIFKIENPFQFISIRSKHSSKGVLFAKSYEFAMMAID